jgi:glycerate kinase
VNVSVIESRNLSAQRVAHTLQDFWPLQQLQRAGVALQPLTDGGEEATEGQRSYNARYR